MEGTLINSSDQNQLNWFRQENFKFHKSQVVIWTISNCQPFTSKEAWKGVVFKFVSFKSLFFNTMFTRRFQYLLHQFASSHFSSMQFEFNSIQSNLHEISFNIFTQMKLNFHQIISIFSSIDELMVIGSAQQSRAQVNMDHTNINDYVYH